MRREEQVLATEFGTQWLDYCHRVPALFPRWRDLNKFGHNQQQQTNKKVN
jgi:hypothetical protein